MNLLYYSLGIFLSLSSAHAASKDASKPDPPCGITSPSSGNFFDLSSLQVHDPATSKSKHPRQQSWNATGYDLGYNFTVNFCAPAIEKVEDVVGVDKDLWRNVSAYYEHDGKVFSIGQQNSELVMRGRKLVLNYTDGSPCDSGASKRSLGATELTAREIVDDDPKKGKDDDDDDDDDKKKEKHADKGRRKSTMISMLCDRDPLAPQLTLSFVGSLDECTYFFEGRSAAACATLNKTKGSLNPGGVFGVIVIIALLVYLAGGCVYNRTVLQQRGWSQVPNYHLWASILGFFKVRSDRGRSEFLD